MAIYSDINGFPESGFPVLSNVSDRIVLNTLYTLPLMANGFIIDVIGNSRLLGALTISGALSGVSTIGASGTVTLSSATAPLTLSGANAVLSMTGANAVLSMNGVNASIGTILSRVKKAWFKDLDIKNTPIVDGEPVALLSDIMRVIRSNDLTIGTGVSGVDFTLTIDGDSNDGVIKWMEDEDYFDFLDTLRAPSIHLDSDVTGIASTNTLTGVTDSPTADPGWASSSTDNMTAPDGYMKAYVGTQAVVIPYWNT